MGFYNPHEEADPVIDDDLLKEAQEWAAQGLRIASKITALMIECEDLGNHAWNYAFDLHLETTLDGIAEPKYSILYHSARRVFDLVGPGQRDVNKEKLEAAINDYAEVSAYDHAANRRADAADLANDLERV